MAWNPLEWAGAAARWAGSTIGGVFSSPSVEVPGRLFCGSCGFRQDPPLPAGTMICEKCQAREGAVDRPAREFADSAIVADRSAETPVRPVPEQDPRIGTLQSGRELALQRARSWLHERVPDHSKDIYALLNQEDGVRQLMQRFWDELSDTERSDLMEQLVAQGFHAPKTFDMLVYWATARLRVRLGEQLRTAMYGPPVQVFRGGLPGQGK